MTIYYIIGELMFRRYIAGGIILLFLLSSIIPIASSNLNNEGIYDGDNYGIQWLKNYGPGDEGGRFEGPQPIGDCDNDGKNELLIAGRDATLTVMEWDEEKQTYINACQYACLHTYPRTCSNGDRRRCR